MYEGLPIATNKISVEERQSIPHHLLGCIKINEEPWTVGTFGRHATEIVAEIRARGKLPIVVGGTHYYTQSLLFTGSLVDDGPEIVSTEEQEKKWPILGASPAEMLAELEKVDPVMAQRWHPKDVRKIRRSLEIYLTRGRKASEIYDEQRMSRGLNTNDSRMDSVDSLDADGDGIHESKHPTASSLQCDPLIFWTHADAHILRCRLDERVEKMLSDGLLSEVESMYTSQCEQRTAGTEVDQTRGIWIAIGYKEFLPYLLAVKAGNTSAKDLERLKHDGIEKTRIHTRQYAKSQTRWIRGKLMTLLERHKASGRLFALDAADLSGWKENVVDIAGKIAQDFLTGGDLPEPMNVLGEAAEGVLRPIKAQRSYARHCEVCDKTTTTEDSWEGHIKSRKHKATVGANRRN